ncbi:phosphoenolpyruvate synthase [Pseudobacteroides cellulosolvens]|uniref:Pyruvate phosphate dikinase PEP/pyruvate-binding protein n=1 Tax=Pseudobacteroides cellulosolvens ATCC 35603 = DSM 2933 TaxID=398512 RepID=A0A0L6JQ13_9FIRM|nr:phosphoenolpyruvate synthase [Pseudobacteroides cellulosolvens]KNY27874.1 pyruvate phosphate dikinase PEP/pyruvate-binding protein [Pseudobacteroides cellulosolvens ATCC 35603 = DSM 2933]
MKMVTQDNIKNYIVGKKAHNLFLAKSYGIPVPELFAISHKDLESNEMASCVNKYLEENFSAEQLFSVRSAALSEDGAENSFAGQFDTFLNVPVNLVVEKINKCRESVYSENVALYCKQQGITEEISMSVIVQRMVNGDYSGVMFTANPQGLLNESVIVIGEGSGDGVVEEKVPTTSYYYNNTDRLYYYESMEGSPVIGREVIEELIGYSDKLKGLFGEYLDIEFTIKNGQIYILQIRPITTLKILKTTILDNSNIVESYPGITLPLTQSFIEFAYYSVFKGVAFRCLKNKKMVEKYDSVFRQMVGSANGRVYYKISNWYTVIKFLPLSKKIIPIWQEMMGVSNKEHDDEKNNISVIQRIRVYFNAIYEAFHVQKGMEKLNASFDRIEKLFCENYHEDMKNRELVNLYNAIGDAVLKDWDITLLNDMYGFVFTALLKRKLKQIGIKNYEQETNQYISGITNIESMKPVRELVALAKMAVDEGWIKRLEALHNDLMLKEFMALNQSDFTNRFINYLRLYGDRMTEELKLETKTFRSNPKLLVDKIVEYGKDIEKLNNLYNTLKCKDTRVSVKFSDNIPKRKVRSVERLSRRAMQGIKNREISRLNRSRIYGMVRTIFLTIGSNMVKEGSLEKKEDIFYLRTEEIFDYIKGGLYDFHSLVRERMEKYKQFEQLPPYSRLVFAGDEFNKTVRKVNQAENKLWDETILTGTPCSNGEARGEVLVIEDVTKANDVKDKILVTKMTDPGWVFFLTLSKGIIAEKGSLLSHTAIISRELGIPSVVGIKGITQKLKTGDVVYMNGSTGEIRIEGR